MKEILDRLQLESFVKVSGSKGLHLHVPLNTPTTYEATQRFAKRLAELVARQHPDDVVSQMAKGLRRGKVFIDWSQNHDHKTTVSVYSLRAKREQPFVAAPITWAELNRALKRGDPDALFFEPDEVLARADKQGDLFGPLLNCRQRCPPKLADALDQFETAPKKFGQARRNPQPKSGSRAHKPLAAYRTKRDFRQTTEPPPPPGPPPPTADEPLFVVQKHQASHLHYDFRLQAEGVLWSWAVPKGVPTQTGEKRLAMRTEDHPVEYARFEGVIPPGNYGAGTVMVWDLGRYALRRGTPAKAMKSGKLSLTLHGKKLNGDWTLFRAPSQHRDDDRETWYLLKAHHNARPLGARRDDQSALSGRTMKAIAADPQAQWTSNRAPPRQAQPRRVDERNQARLRRQLARLPKATPRLVKPMAYRTARTLPKGKDWIYEIPFDGYRTLALKKGAVVTLHSPDAAGLEKRFPHVVEAVAQLPVNKVLLDGALVALDTQGRPAPKRLRSKSRSPVFYYTFDLLNYDGRNPTKLPLVERKALLRALLADASDPLRLSARFAAAAAVATEFQKQGLPGVIAKRARSKYVPGQRSSAWNRYEFPAFG